MGVMPALSRLAGFSLLVPILVQVGSHSRVSSRHFLPRADPAIYAIAILRRTALWSSGILVARTRGSSMAAEQPGAAAQQGNAAACSPCVRLLFNFFLHLQTILCYSYRGKLSPSGIDR